MRAARGQSCRLAAGGKIKFAFKWEPSNAGVFVTQPGPFTELVAECRSPKSPAASRNCPPPAAPRTRASSPRYCPVVEFGLVGQTMHQVDERVPIADLRALTTIYRKIVDSISRDVSPDRARRSASPE